MKKMIFTIAFLAVATIQTSMAIELKPLDKLVSECKQLEEIFNIGKVADKILAEEAFQKFRLMGCMEIAEIGRSITEPNIKG